MRLPVNSAAATTGWVRNRLTGVCRPHSSHSRGPREPSRRGASVRRASVTGAAGTSRSGATMLMVMCWSMWVLKRTRP